jgi:hypothetical protein
MDWKAREKLADAGHCVDVLLNRHASDFGESVTKGVYG